MSQFAKCKHSCPVFETLQSIQIFFFAIVLRVFETSKLSLLAFPVCVTRVVSIVLPLIVLTCVAFDENNRTTRKEKQILLLR